MRRTSRTANADRPTPTSSRRPSRGRDWILLLVAGLPMAALAGCAGTTATAACPEAATHGTVEAVTATSVTVNATAGAYVGRLVVHYADGFRWLDAATCAPRGPPAAGDEVRLDVGPALAKSLPPQGTATVGLVL